MSNGIKSFLGLFIFLVIIVGIGYGSWEYLIKDEMKTYAKDQSMHIDHTITLGYDGYIGYSVLSSRKNQDFLKEKGIKIDFLDDAGAYNTRIKQLKNGVIDIAVMPIHDFIEIYGTIYGDIGYNSPMIIGAIAESKGADAIISNPNKVQNIDALKNKDISIAYTSKFLLGSLAIDINQPKLIENAYFNNDIKKSYNGLLNGTYDVVALWEPLVSKAKAQGYKVLLDSSDLKLGKIIDVIIVSEDYYKKHNDKLIDFMEAYYKSVNYYSTNSMDLINEISTKTGENVLDIDKTFKSIKLYELTDNVNYLFDVTYQGSNLKNYSKNKIEKFTNGIINKLINMGSIKSSNILNNDIKNIYTTKYLEEVSNKLPLLANKELNFEDKSYEALSSNIWEKLITNPKFTRDDLNIQFLRNGTLDNKSKEVLDNFMKDQISNFDYYIAIVGKSAKVSGISQEALIQRTENKAEKVYNYLKETYNIKENRFKFIGMGSKNTPSQGANENYYQYLNNNNKVELIFVDY